jgi:hypothetical protein
MVGDVLFANIVHVGEMKFKLILWPQVSMRNVVWRDKRCEIMGPKRGLEPPQWMAVLVRRLRPGVFSVNSEAIQTKRPTQSWEKQGALRHR